MHPTAEVLQTARNIISDEKNWTQGAYARDSEYNPINEAHDSAVCFCSLGAIFKAAGSHLDPRYDAGVSELTNTLGERRAKAMQEGKPKPTRNVPSYNDHPDTKHADVLSLFDDTIKRLSSTTQK